MKYIITKAYTGSEWDDVSFAVIEMSRGHVANILSLHEEAQRIYKDQSGYIVVFADMADFFTTDELSEAVDSVLNLLEDDIPYVVDVPKGFFEGTSRPEQTISYGEYRVSKTAVQYCATGKHSDDEFWTTEIPIELIKEINSQL